MSYFSLYCSLFFHCCYPGAQNAWSPVLCPLLKIPITLDLKFRVSNLTWTLKKEQSSYCWAGERDAMEASARLFLSDHFEKCLLTLQVVHIFGNVTSDLCASDGSVYSSGLINDNMDSSKSLGIKVMSERLTTIFEKAKLFNSCNCCGLKYCIN